MMYREIEKTGDNLSILGYGCMRFPRKNGMIDEERTENQVISAIEKGVNYFDTAYIYPGSEKVLGKILAKGYRDKVKVGTKLPLNSLKDKEDMNQIFEKQLKRLKTDYIDYYLIHSIYTFKDWENLKGIGILSFIKEEQEKGRIINIGFSFHGNSLNFKKIVDDYPWDFCQIQYNYLDENYQAGKEGLEYATSKGLGIIAMEPLRGGLLIDKMPNAAKEIINNFEVKKSPAEWALNWLWDHPEIHVVLSGMNKESHIEENINIASNALPNSFTDSEKTMLNSIKREFQNKLKITCTGCAYCLPCPYGVDIPICFASYNDKAMFGKVESIIKYLIATDNKTSASKCEKCGSCEKKCPQDISIIEELNNVSSTMEKWYYKLIASIIKLVL